MAQNYSYKVRDKQGKIISGKLEADSEAIVSQRLREMGYFIVGIEEQKVSLSKKEIRLFKPKIKSKDINIFTRQFATMINAGLPLVKCLSILTEQTESPVFTAIIADVQHEVEMGRSLSEALAKHPEAFKDLYTSMVKAGEIGGVLDDVLLRVATTLESEAEIRQRIKSAMTYPAAMFCISILLLIVMIVFVVPTFENMFKNLGASLPFLTKIIMTISHFVASIKGVFILIILIVGFVLLKRWIKTPKGRRKLDALKLKIPVFGILFHKMSLSRFSRTLGTLVASGVPILQALEITSKTVGNMLVAEAVDSVRAGVKEGDSIARPLGQSPLFPPMVTQMLAIGEETGALDTMLNKVSEFYDSEVSSTVESLTSLLEPLLIVSLGLVVGIIVLALYMPIFSLISQFQKK
ncbi:MAG: pilus assembly protein PilC [Candidatus Solincola sediminis]|uniref:Pilus assembly protein PilC n=1 Tax=Candidatus Solincola sediminis TaxID=1797199 RepID=A0A1F2WFL7_9ACTN|nr:MAG: pilus assembly protein PilC [Candidatus Solincola sediminis]